MKTFSAAMIATMMLGASASLYANEPPPTVIDQCPGEFKPATVELTGTVSTSQGCPLLKTKELLKLVNKFGVGSVFPGVQGTCLSGTILDGSRIVIHDGGSSTIQVTGYSESAQRLFPEATALDPSSPLFITGLAGALVSGITSVPFASGSAMTVVSLTGDDDFNMTLVLDDRFSINFSIYPFVDTEDFLIVGTKGIYEAKGRLNGTAIIVAPPPAPLVDVEFKIFGKICLKEL